MELPKKTHEAGVRHIKEIPVPIIFDDNELNIPRYNAFMGESMDYKVKATEMMEKPLEGEENPLGIVITLSLKSPNDFMEFVIYPDNEFVTELVSGKRLHFGNSKGLSFFSFLVDAKPIENVWKPTRN